MQDTIEMMQHERLSHQLRMLSSVSNGRILTDLQSTLYQVTTFWP